MKTKFHALLFLVIASLFILTNSCSKDDENEMNLSGTTWKCVHDDYTLYLKFNTKATYTFRAEDDFPEDQWIKWDNVYIITGNVIKLTDDEEEIHTGTVSGNTIKIDIWTGTDTFTKQ